MDPILQDAFARRDAASAEVDRWSQFIRMYEELRGHTTYGCLGTDPNMARPVAELRRPAIRRSVKVRETEAAAIEIIRDFGPAVPTRRLLEFLHQRGVEVGGKQPVATLNTRLNRSTSLEYERPHGWKVRSEPRQMEEATDPTSQEGESVASETPNDAVARGEAEHEMTT